MAWKEIRNGEPDTYKITTPGICKQTGKTAEVTSFFCGRIECKTDLQKTYGFKGFGCSLHAENPSCVDMCPLIQKERL